MSCLLQKYIYNTVILIDRAPQTLVQLIVSIIDFISVCMYG